MLRIFIVVVALILAAITITGLGAFDGSTKLKIAKTTASPLKAVSVTIAPRSKALSFARLKLDNRTIAVNDYQEGIVSGVSLDTIMQPGEDAIALLNRLGYDAVEAFADYASNIIHVDEGDLDIPVQLGNKHIAVGTNYREHAQEAEIEGGPFLFPKYVQPTSANTPIAAGAALLDVEVEMCLVTLQPLLPKSGASGGLILCNDVTDRAALLRYINPDNPESGVGFTTGKSAPGFLPVGNIFVVPRDIRAFSGDLTLQLSVNGNERQRSVVLNWIWDMDRVLIEAASQRGASWVYGGTTARLPFDADGMVPARTLILSGTPAGTIFRGIYPSAIVRGGLTWLAGGWDIPLTQRIIASQIAIAQASGTYLRPGDMVSITVDQMGALANPVE